MNASDMESQFDSMKQNSFVMIISVSARLFLGTDAAAGVCIISYSCSRDHPELGCP